ncbi:MAG: Transposase, IS4 family [Clostridiales bacterium 38_11]|nr:MAG: Transposase, IS4 family [Clostridiales bacterium 38_11]
MYLDFLVKIPDAPGKLVRVKKKNTIYIDYEYDRIYDRDKQYTTPKRSTIGKLSKADDTMMQPNQNFLKFFPEADLPEEKERAYRSSCLRIGTYIVIKKIVKDYFLNVWNESKDHREKIYISYDSTNKNCQAGEVEMSEYGHAKDEKGLPIFNYAIAYDTHNNEPLFYEKYPGSINDVAQLQFLLDKVQGYGYKKIGFILDRGYFSKGNIEFMDRCGYEFVIMVKGLASFVNQLIHDNKGTFENKRVHNIPEYNVSGMTVKKKLYVTDESDRYFHIYHSISKESSERTGLEAKIQQMTRYLSHHTNEIKEFGASLNKYFELYYDENQERFLFATEQIGAIEREIDLCGYFVIITSRKMTAKEAINLYKSCDASEKLFQGDKSYLGNKSIRVHSNESASGKIFIEFIALIIRNKIYTYLKEEKKNLDKKPNFMTVPAAIKELEKIEMVRQLDNVYRLDHAVTATQKAILKAFGLDATYIKYKAAEISSELKR